ncbi:callisulfakinin [Periplaneta americana]
MASSMMATLLLTLGVYLVLQHQYHTAVHAAPSNPDVASSGSGNLEGAGQRGRSRTPPRASQYLRARLVPLEAPADILNDFVIDDEVVDFNKRQSDDYGHMRFGKREQFDDYGHMRFGRSIE